MGVSNEVRFKAKLPIGSNHVGIIPRIIPSHGLSFKSIMVYSNGVTDGITVPPTKLDTASPTSFSPANT